MDVFDLEDIECDLFEEGEYFSINWQQFIFVKEDFNEAEDIR
jgi:hypothetical protein